MQTMLNTLGHYNGPINGVMDSATRDAVKAFQRSPAGAGLTDDGDPGPKDARKALQGIHGRDLHRRRQPAFPA
ncbi:MAG: peptidoglycan-binding domain-containing protein [Pyrinomonadaceae bacterium]